MAAAVVVVVGSALVVEVVAVEEVVDVEEVVVFQTSVDRVVVGGK